MSYAAPTLHVEPTGGVGEFFVRITGELRPVQLLYQVDDLIDGGEWQVGEKFPVPGLYRVSGFNDFTWYNFTAIHVNNGGSAISPPADAVKSRPEFQLPNISVDLVREDSIQYVAGRTNGFRSRIQAYPLRGITEAIFLYRRETFGHSDRDVFVAVCKPGDIDEYPEGAPTVSTYFRLNYVDLVDRAYVHRDENWGAITEDVDELVTALGLQAEYSTEEIA
jgi:hypothetical protein